MIEFLQNIDSQIMLALNGAHCEYIDQFMYLFSGKWEWIPAYICILIALVKWRGWRQAIILLVAIGLIITVCDQLCGHVVRNYFERPRPSNPDGPLGQLIHVVNGYRGGPYGFPSCHAANAFGLSIFLSLTMRNRIVTATMLIWAILTAYSRIVLGVHYPGDLLVGAAVGSLVAWGASALTNRYFRHQPEPGTVGTKLPARIIAVAFGATTAIMLIAAAFIAN